MMAEIRSKSAGNLSNDRGVAHSPSLAAVRIISKDCVKVWLTEFAPQLGQKYAAPNTSRKKDPHLPLAQTLAGPDAQQMSGEMSPGCSVALNGRCWVIRDRARPSVSLSVTGSLSTETALLCRMLHRVSNDRLEERLLAAWFEVTRRVWADRSHCTCIRCGKHECRS